MSTQMRRPLPAGAPPGATCGGGGTRSGCSTSNAADPPGASSTVTATGVMRRLAGGGCMGPQWLMGGVE